MVSVCLGAPEDRRQWFLFKTSQKTGQWLKAASDRLEEPGIELGTPGYNANNTLHHAYVSLFVCFVALRPKSTAMVIAGRSVHLTTLFPGQA